MKSSIKADLLFRRENYVCKMCGGPLEIRMIIYNQYGGEGQDLYCPNCARIEYGTKPEIYHVAKQFVDKFEFNYFTEMAENERNYQLNISKICDIAEWVLKNITHTENGLK